MGKHLVAYKASDLSWFPSRNVRRVSMDDKSSWKRRWCAQESVQIRSVCRVVWSLFTSRTPSAGGWKGSWNKWAWSSLRILNKTKERNFRNERKLIREQSQVFHYSEIVFNWSCCSLAPTSYIQFARQGSIIICFRICVS